MILNFNPNDPWSDPRNIGLLSLGAGLLSAGGPQRLPTNIGQAFGNSGLQALGAMQEARQAQLQGAYRGAQMRHLDLESQQLQGQQDQEAALQSALSNPGVLNSPSMGVLAPQQSFQSVQPIQPANSATFQNATLPDNISSSVGGQAPTTVVSAKAQPPIPMPSNGDAYRKQAAEAQRQASVYVNFPRYAGQAHAKQQEAEGLQKLADAADEKYRKAYIGNEVTGAIATQLYKGGSQLDTMLDPNIAVAEANAALNIGDLQSFNTAIDKAAKLQGLKQQGFHTVDQGDKQIIMQGGKVVTAIPKNLSPNDQQNLALKAVEAQIASAKLGYETGANVQAPTVSLENGKPVVNFAQQTPPTMGGQAPSQTAPGRPVRSAFGMTTNESPNSIFAGLPPKEKNDAIRQQFQQSHNELQKDREMSDSSQQTVTDIGRWKQLNATTATGPMVGGAVSGTIRGQYDPQFQEMRKLSDKLQAQAALMKGQGLISNYERGIAKNAYPTVDADRQANENVGNMILGGAQNMRDRTAFKEAFLQKYQTLNRATEWWNDYVNTNPVYIADKNNNMVPNQNRMDWQSYLNFRADGAKPLPVQTGTYNQIDQGKMKSGDWYITSQGPRQFRDGKLYAPGEK